MKQSIVGIFGTFFLFAAIMFFSSNLYADSKSTVYVVHWTHTPENCPGRSGEGAKMLSKFWEGKKKAEEKGVKVLGAYVTVTEHDYYFIVEASDYSTVVEFFLPLISSQTGKFTPVLTMDEWLKIMPK